MHDGVRKLLGVGAGVGAVGLLAFGSRYRGGSRYSIATTVGLGAEVQTAGFLVSAVLFFGCAIAVGASLDDGSADGAD